MIHIISFGAIIKFSLYPGSILADKLDDLDRQIESMKAAALAEKNGGASGGKASDGLSTRTAAVQAKIAEMDMQKRKSEEQVPTLNLECDIYDLVAQAVLIKEDAEDLEA